jgi:hypothetical protein
MLNVVCQATSVAPCTLYVMILYACIIIVKQAFFFLKELDDKSLLLDSCKQLIFCILPARNVINRSARLMGSYAMTLDEQFTAFQRVSVLSSSASGSPISDKV